MAATDSADDPASIAQARLRLHAALLHSAVGVSLMAACVLVVLVWGSVDGRLLAVWSVAVLLALGLRLAVARAHRRAAAAEPATWLRRYRMTYALHGAAWAVPALLMARPETAQQMDLLALGLAGVAGVALVATAFDRVAALLFVLPVLLPLLLRLFAPGRPLLVGVTVLLFLGVMAISARRAERVMRDGVRLQRTEADQQRLFSQLLLNTPQGCWFIDNDGITTDINPAMCRLLGRPREQMLGRSVFEFFSGDDLQTVRRELAARPEVQAAVYEVGIVHADGSRRLCRNHATPISDAAGRRVGSVGLWTDLSAHVQAQAALRIYEQVTNSITDMVSVVGEDHVYRMVNDAWCRNTGLTSQQALGRRASEMLPPLASEERRAALRDCLAQQQVRVVRGVADLAGKPGHVIETSFYPSGEDADGVRCVVVVTRDIDNEARALAALQASEAEQRALLDAFPGYIARLDASLRYSYVNQRLAGLFGSTPEAIVGRSVRQLFGTGREAVVSGLVTRALAGEAVVFERHHEGGDAGEREVQITLAAGADPRSGQPSVYAFGVDITGLKQAERAMLAARDEAEAANSAKSRFLSQMSHELRTPMNAILGFAQLLDADPQPPLAPHQQAQVHEILGGARHLLELINEVLDLGRIEAGQLLVERRPVALVALAAEGLGLMQPLAQQHAVRLLPLRGGAEAVEVAADSMRLRQVLLNLLGNAIKYNRAGGEVEVEIGLEIGIGEMASAGAGSATLSVRDTGHGLSPEHQQRLFQPFERLDAGQSGIEGTGIGLALSRRLVEAMGGEIGVHSEPGRGSRFWVRLPLAGSAAVAPAAAVLPAPAAVAAAAPATVLYIEDNAVNVLLMQAMLERLPGLRLLTTASPAEGLLLAQRERPALLLLDIQMPGMDGFEVLARLRTDPAFASVPAIAVSANARQSDIDAALAAGFCAYLTKPVDLGELLATVQAALAGSLTQAVRP